MQKSNKQQKDETNKLTTRKQDRFSSLGSDSEERKTRKPGSINCLCLYYTFEPDMVKCVECGEFSHKKQVLKSVLNQEYSTCQPGVEPGTKNWKEDTKEKERT